MVKLNDDTLTSTTNGSLTVPDAPDGASLGAIFSRYAEFAFGPAIKGGPDWLTALRFCAARNTNTDHADLTAFLSAPVTEKQRYAAIQLVRDLLGHPLIETAWLRGPLMVPAADIPPDTPAFDWQQRYWDPAPTGINIRSAWYSHYGTLGVGLNYVDLENAWTMDHEDFPAIGDRRTVFPIVPPGHGTAVVGLLSAAQNGYGTHGAIPQAAPFVMDDHTRIAAALADPLHAGDALILELAYLEDPKTLCATSGQTAALPLERDDAHFNQIQQLTANGVVVFEAAGNESLNLDDPCWNGELSRGGRDSGAIFVAAGDVANCGPGATPMLTAASFTNHGSRIDANAWGHCVTTTGHNGDLFNPGDDARQRYTQTFAGTSSATPIVMAAGMALQGWQKARTGRTYGSATLRTLLQRFGTSTSGAKYIAKQPDVGAALAWLTADDDGDGVVNGDELSSGAYQARQTDLNADGKSDLLYRNAATGQIYRMLMDGLAITSQALTYTEPNIAWKIVADADFDGDGIADLLWRNESTGSLAIQFYNINGFPAPVIPFPYTEPDPAWKIVQTPDIDGDGKADIVWWNSLTGKVSATLMIGSSVKSVFPEFYAEPDTAWKIVSSGDFAGSGVRNQLLWRNGSTGQVYLMTLSVAGQTISQTGLLIYQEPDTAWKIIAAADFNGDDKSDILWRNDATGQIWIMLMNGPTIISQGPLYLEPNLAWKVVAVGDYNGNGKADLLWRNESTGEVYMMLLNGLSIVSQAMVFAEPDLNWKLLGPWEYGKSAGIFP